MESVHKDAQKVLVEMEPYYNPPEQPESEMLHVLIRTRG